MKVGDIVQVYEDPITEKLPWFMGKLIAEDNEFGVGVWNNRNARRWSIEPIGEEDYLERRLDVTILDNVERETEDTP